MARLTEGVRIARGLENASHDEIGQTDSGEVRMGEVKGDSQQSARRCETRCVFALRILPAAGR